MDTEILRLPEKLKLFVTKQNGDKIPVELLDMTEEDAQSTEGGWLTSWTSDFIHAEGHINKAVKTGNGELVALACYQDKGKGFVTI